MKNRTSLVLMEQLVMVMVFALAAALCLGVFVKADRICAETADRDGAVLLAQNGAEVLKSCSGDTGQAALLLGGTPSETGLTVQSDGYIMEVQLTESGISGLGQADIHVFWDEELIFSLRTGWQEVGK